MQITAGVCCEMDSEMDSFSSFSPATCNPSVIWNCLVISQIQRFKFIKKYKYLNINQIQIVTGVLWRNGQRNGQINGKLVLRFRCYP
jgi:hypothetical protein